MGSLREKQSMVIRFVK